MKLIKKIGQTGWCYTFAIAFNRLIPAWLFRCRRFVVYELKDVVSGDQPQIDLDVSYCQTEEEIEEVERLTQFSRARYRSSTSDSVTLPYSVQARTADQLAGAIWIATTCFQEEDLGVAYEFESNQAWIFSAFVDHAYRKQGIYSETLRFANREKEGKGFAQLLVAVNPDNLRSHRVHQKNAARKVGTCFSARLFKISFCLTWGSLKSNSRISFNSQSNPIVIRFD